MNDVNLSRWAVRHPSFICFLIVSIALMGAQAYLWLGRAEDPPFTIKTMAIWAAWPGATAEQMESQVADRIEKKLQGLPQLDYIKSYCISGQAFLQVWIKDTTDPKMVPELWYQVRKKLGDVRQTFPDGVSGPHFNDEYGDVYSAVYAFTGQEYSLAELKSVAQTVRQRLLRVDEVDKVDLVGEQSEKVFVEISHQKLAALKIPPQRIFDSVRAQNAVLPAGHLETDTDRIQLRVDGQFDSSEFIRDVPVYADGRLFRLEDIAAVRCGFEDPAQFLIRHNGQPAVGLAINMKKGGNVLTLGDRIEELLPELRNDIPLGIEVHRVSFQPGVVREAVGEFTRAFLEALVIVLGMGFITLGLRAGVVVALSVPLVLAAVFLSMQLLGMSLDRISLGSLIISLGLLVDDAIIAVEMMIVKIEEGFDRASAATFAWKSTAWPMLTGTLVTLAGFLPIGLAKSSTGEYAGGIFWVVGLALLFSWVCAVLFTPFLGSRLLSTKVGKQGSDHHSQHQRWLRALITRCASRPWVVLATTSVLFLAALGGFVSVRQQFFPDSERRELLVEIRNPEGSSIASTLAEVNRLEQVLSAQPGIDGYTAFVGAGAPRFYLALNPDLPNPSFAKLIVMCRDVESRERLRAELRRKFKDDAAFARARWRTVRLAVGPPLEFPIEFRVIGPDRGVILETARKVQAALAGIPEIEDAQLAWSEPAKVLRLKVDQERLRAMNVTPTDLANVLQFMLNGVTISQYREGTELIEVVARASRQDGVSISDVCDLSVAGTGGRVVPLSQVAHVAHELEEPIIWRRNSERYCSVRADVADGVQAPDATAKAFPRLNLIVSKLPPGYRVEVGGAAEESAKANQALFAVFPLTILCMFALLMMQLQSVAKALLVCAISPLGLIGAVLFLLVFDAPFGFVALLGLISLVGMDMRNSVILLDQIEFNIAHGQSRWDAVIEATVRRARPVVLTAVTAIVAMIPLTRSVFWGPMAITIMGGLSVATFLTLVNLPALYIVCFRVARTNMGSQGSGAMAH